MGPPGRMHATSVYACVSQIKEDRQPACVFLGRDRPTGISQLASQQAASIL